MASCVYVRFKDVFTFLSQTYYYTIHASYVQTYTNSTLLRMILIIYNSLIAKNNNKNVCHIHIYIQVLIYIIVLHIKNILQYANKNN